MTQEFKGVHAVRVGESMLASRSANKPSAGSNNLRKGTSNASTSTPSSSHSNLNSTSSSLLHGIKYNFQPGTLDLTKPGLLKSSSSGTSGEETLTLTLHGQSGEQHVYRGTRQPMKDVDCVLVYDEATQSYTLERLGTMARLDHQRSKAAKEVPAPSAVPVPAGKKLQSSTPAETENSVSKETPAAEAKVNNKSASTQTSAVETKSSLPSSRTRSHSTASTAASQPKVPAKAKPPAKPTTVQDINEDEDEDLDDFASMLESTLGSESGTPAGSTAQPSQRSTRRSTSGLSKANTGAADGDESSEDDS
ncbi:hypothetical protein PYCC9005_002056 [Savitreella phatthalungensis]